VHDDLKIVGKQGVTKVNWQRYAVS